MLFACVVFSAIESISEESLICMSSIGSSLDKVCNVFVEGASPAA